jgi:putative transposase
VTKVRRKALIPELLNYLQGAFCKILTDWRCILLELGEDRIILIIFAEVRPALDISTLINNLITASFGWIRTRFRITWRLST